MVLRNYSRTQASPGRLRAILMIMVAVALVGAFITLRLKSRSLVVRFDANTLCPTDRAVASVTAVILDVSDRFSEAQTLAIQHQLQRIEGGIPRFGLVEVYTVERMGRGIAQPVVHLCNPGTDADVSAVYQNPAHARARWQHFSDTLHSEFAAMLSHPAMSSSPIFETIQAVALRTMDGPQFDSVSKRLIVISDFMQNVPDGLSMYNGVPDFRIFKLTPYYARVRADLRGVSVTGLYLERSGLRTQNGAHVSFWEHYFQDQGASLDDVEKVYGDSEASL